MGFRAVQKLGTGLITAGVMFGALAAVGLTWSARTSAAGSVAEARGGTAIRVEPGVAGTATGIAPGLLLTNSHVVRGCQRQGLPIRVVGLPGAWDVRLQDADADLALLAGPPGMTHPTLAVSGITRLPRGTAVTAFGFAAGTAASLQGSSGEVLRAGLTIRDAEGRWSGGFVLRDGAGREIQPRWEDGVRYFGAQNSDRLRWTLEIDTVVPPGSSGGPVLDAAGQVVGIIYAGDPGRRLTAVVPIEDVREFLRRAEVHPRIGTRQARAPEPVAAQMGAPLAAQAAAQAVFQIRC